MFNKPNLFHKTAEMPAARSPRPLGGAVSARPVSPEMPATPAAADVAASEAVSAAQGNAVEAVTAVPTERSGESRLIVGPDVKLKGAEILDCDTLVVEGRVEATMDSRVLRIAEAGAYKGTVGIDIAEIHGHFEGELTARVQLLIHSTGRVSGKIRYGKILIEEGGEISGDVQSLVAGAKDGLRAVERTADMRPLAAAG
ncbi:MAG TPA: polymer-forming cytoskeletal protein [Thauera sp.]|uniref:bactofilin family protein n=1 Tax=unclassified Thauera TaxID=2609274 RepID=UPI0002CFD6A0|nr:MULTISPECIES: polymer-forming cytoskeletal protein [unclassified Thauera]HAY10516.1 polymer-forming cytoskeletal protein [Thauera sp.]ENO94365.1 hypothetical protein C662_02420 [Thauera sp. 28]WBL63246.1 polymer-forming cytoskeletal protein [Thauera sp. WB-2]HRJ23371.1 polymer-forming cytoskeletal protein [Thauera sp.]HRK11208.1 polymer-forming cytoskeletal protein [Thauera sp.]